MSDTRETNDQLSPTLPPPSDPSSKFSGVLPVRLLKSTHHEFGFNGILTGNLGSGVAVQQRPVVEICLNQV